MINKLLIVLVLLILIILGCFFVYKTTVKKIAEEKNIATVNGSAIKQKDINQELSRINAFYSFSKQKTIDPSTVQKDVFERVVEDKIIQEYAKDNNISVSQDEINQRYKEVLSKKIEDSFLSQIYNMYKMSKNDYLQVLKMDILREKVQKKVGQPLARWLEIEKQKANIQKF